MMDQALLSLGFTGLLTLAMMWVIVSDALRYIIPNWLNLAIMALWVVGLFVLPADPLWALLAALLVFSVGIASFALGLMGGGDVKLLIALTLWTGWGMPTFQFLFMTAVAGGVLVIVVLLLRAVLPGMLRKKNPEKPLPRLLTKKQPVPYGLAIATAFLWLLAIDGVPMLAH